MCNNKKFVDMGFVGEKYPEGTHMCFIFSRKEERERIISEYVNSGLAGGEYVGYYINVPKESETIYPYKAKTDKNNTEYKGEFKLTRALDTYCPEGFFDPDKMLGNLKEFYVHNCKEQNFPAVRVTGEMEWALEDLPGTEKLMLYEAKVNDLLNDYPVTAICQYDASKFDALTIMECMKVHPYIIVNRQIIKNTYYMPTEEYLANSYYDYLKAVKKGR